MAENTSPIEMAFAQVLRKQRLEAGISQEELAHRAGVSMRYISMLERNINQPSLSVMFQIATSLGISFSDFIQLIEDAYKDAGNT